MCVVCFPVRKTHCFQRNLNHFHHVLSKSESKLLHALSGGHNTDPLGAASSTWEAAMKLRRSDCSDSRAKVEKKLSTHPRNQEAFGRRKCINWWVLVIYRAKATVKSHPHTSTAWSRIVTNRSLSAAAVLARKRTGVSPNRIPCVQLHRPASQETLPTLPKPTKSPAAGRTT